ncbi:MAG: DUF4169 domain-containing protein [Rhizobiales bacterium PAR1]|nr:MAG: DUF4169 domain-containing protein [Rhizobiales bacterium PAR1]
MMAEIINLRMARKAKARGEAEKQAEQNRAKFGQTKAEKKVRKLEEARAAKAHAAGALEKPEGE